MSKIAEMRDAILVMQIGGAGPSCAIVTRDEFREMVAQRRQEACLTRDDGGQVYITGLPIMIAEKLVNARHAIPAGAYLSPAAQALLA